MTYEKKHPVVTLQINNITYVYLRFIMFINYKSNYVRNSHKDLNNKINAANEELGGDYTT